MYWLCPVEPVFFLTHKNIGGDVALLLARVIWSYLAGQDIFCWFFFSSLLFLRVLLIAILPCVYHIPVIFFFVFISFDLLYLFFYTWLDPFPPVCPFLHRLKCWWYVSCVRWKRKYSIEGMRDRVVKLAYIYIIYILFHVKQNGQYSFKLF